MDLEDALIHALALIDTESERLIEQGAHPECELVFENDAANDTLSALLVLTRGGNTA
jgi:hypothetical protein